MEQNKKLSQRIEEAYRNDSRLFAFYADFLKKTGYEGKAVSILKENINSHPNYSTGEKVLAEIFMKQNKADMAEMLLEGALKKDPFDLKALKLLSQLYDMKGDEEKSIECMRSIMSIDPFDQDARNIIRLNEKISHKESPFQGTLAPEEDDIDTVEEEQLKESEIARLESSDDIDVPEIPEDREDEVFSKHEFGEKVFDKEKSFSEDIIESLDELTESFIDESGEDSKEADGGHDLSGIISFKDTGEEDVKEEEVKEEEVKEEEVKEEEVKEEDYGPEISYRDEDPIIDEILKSLVYTPGEYKKKMDDATKLVDEDNENYDLLVDLAHARFKYASSCAKKEIFYYYKKSKEEPKNYKYAENLNSYRDEILKIKADLIEELNMLKNEYY